MCIKGSPLSASMTIRIFCSEVNILVVLFGISLMVNKAINRLTLLDTIYCQSANYDKRKLIGSMYPQKFTFEDLQHRTAKSGDLYSFIYLINSELEKKKRRASDKNLCLPSLAPQAGRNSNQVNNISHDPN